MRKAIGIVVGCILLCGQVMAAMLATPSPNATITVTIIGKTVPHGVDMPWFELSKGKKETVSWTNGTAYDCRVIFGGESPFDTNVITVAQGATSDPKSATNAPEPSAEDKKHPDRVYKFYKYTIACEKDGGVFDPGGGIKP